MTEVLRPTLKSLHGEGSILTVTKRAPGLQEANSDFVLQRKRNKNCSRLTVSWCTSLNPPSQCHDVHPWKHQPAEIFVGPLKSGRATKCTPQVRSGKLLYPLKSIFTVYPSSQPYFAGNPSSQVGQMMCTPQVRSKFMKIRAPPQVRSGKWVYPLKSGKAN